MAVLLTSTGTLSGQFQKFFIKKLLTPVDQLLVMDQLAQFALLPEHQGAKTVTFTKPDAMDRSRVGAVTEGDPSTLSESGYTYTFTDATCTQIGAKKRISDILSATNLFDTIKNSLDAMGRDAAAYLDFAITTEVVPNVASASKKYSGNTSFANLVSDTTVAAYLDIAQVLKEFTRLRVNRAPTAKPNERAPGAKGGKYVAVLPPQVAYNVKLDPKFIDCGTHGTSDGLFNGEVGTWYGVRCIEGTQPWIESSTENTYDSAGTIYSTVVTGSEEFGVVNLAKKSPLSPKINIVDTPDHSNPAGQYVSLAWTAYFVVKTLTSNWASVIRSKSSFS